MTAAHFGKQKKLSCLLASVADMEKFSNDPLENFLINCLDNDPALAALFYFNDHGEAIYYFLDDKKWEFDDGRKHRSPEFDFTDSTARAEIIRFLIEAKPDLERELLRARQEEILTAPLALEAL